MDELQEALHKFDRAVDHFDRAEDLIDYERPDENAVKIALAEAKRVRRESNLVVRALARLRDQLQA